MSAAHPKAKRGLKPRIVKMFSDGYPVPYIAKTVGCSRPNIYKILKNLGITTTKQTWNGYIAPLPPKLEHYLVRTAKASGVTMSELAKALLIDAIELAIEEDADLKCTGKRTNTAHWGNRPLPSNLQPRITGSPRTPRTLLALEGPGHGSASAGTSSAKSE